VGSPFECVCKTVGRCTELPSRGETFSHRQTLPVTIGFSLLLFGLCDPADCLVCTQSSRSRTLWTEMLLVPRGGIRTPTILSGLRILSPPPNSLKVLKTLFL